MNNGRPTESGQFRLAVPTQVEIDSTGTRLCWRWDEPTEWKTADSKMLKEFVSLANAPSGGILKFARRYGPLSLCKHGLPMYHNWSGVPPDQKLLQELVNLDLLDDSAWDYLSMRDESCETQWESVSDPQTGAVHVWRWEPLAAWRRFAREASAIRAVTEPLRRGQLAIKERLHPLEDEGDLRLLNALTQLDRPSAKPVEYSSEWHRTIVKLHLERWLTLGRIGPRVGWDATTPRIHWEPEGLFGALALRLAATLTEAGNLATCDGCGRLYARERAPSRTGRNFCDDCSAKGVPHKLAMRDKRERQRREQGRSNDPQPM